MLRTRAPVATNIAIVLPLDLHVLSLPLAFILSQDQTLHSKWVLILTVLILKKRKLTSQFRNVIRLTYLLFVIIYMITCCCFQTFKELGNPLANTANDPFEDDKTANLIGQYPQPYRLILTPLFPFLSTTSLIWECKSKKIFSYSQINFLIINFLTSNQ